MTRFLIGILNEKPSQAKNFAKALGGMRGTFNGEDYVIVAAHGHLYEYKDPSEMVKQDLVKKYHDWDVSNLPWNWRDLDFSYHKKKGASSTLRQIKQTLQNCDEICIATDDDPTGEGEKLAWEILDQLRFRPKKWSRMYFTDEAAPSVQKAFKNRVTKPDMFHDPDMIEAELRARWDFMSMPWTRLATQAVSNKAVLRQGRLKTSMVVLVGQQFDKINNYKKIPFYTVRYKDENGNIFTDPHEQQFVNKITVDKSKTEPVQVVNKQKKHTIPPKMYTLAGISTELESKYGIKSAQVLKTYQKMYEDDILSYPRTEDKVISHEQFNQLLPLVPKIANLVGVDTKLLTHLQPRPTHVKDGGSHGANRPGLTVPDSLASLSQYGPGAREIYVLLAKNYLATLAEDYIYEQQTANLVYKPNFVSTINIPLSAGWKAIFNTDPDTDTGTQFGKIAEPFVHTGYPTKPTTPTMKWLFKELNKYNVGTGATQTSTYADITNARSKYPLLKSTRGKITLTEYGEWSAKLMQGTKLADLKITQDLNNRMHLLRKSKAGWKEIGQWLDEEMDILMYDSKIILANGENLRKLKGINKMNNDRLEGQWTDSDGNTIDVKIKNEWRGHTWTKQEADDLFNGKKVTVKLTSKSGHPYEMLAYLAHQSFTNSEGKTVKGVWVTGDFAPKKASIPDEFCGHKFTSDEKQKLENGETIHVSGLVSKKGSKFEANISWGDKEWQGRTVKGLILSFD